MRNLLLIVATVLVATVVFAFRLVQLLLGSMLYVYLLPGVIAQKRQHPRTQAIYLVSGLAGWLILPWLAAFAYARKEPNAQTLPDHIPLAATIAKD
jgi:hypothetical protein